MSAKVEKKKFTRKFKGFDSSIECRWNHLGECEKKLFYGNYNVEFSLDFVENVSKAAEIQLNFNIFINCESNYFQWDRILVKFQHVR